MEQIVRDNNQEGKCFYAIYAPCGLRHESCMYVELKRTHLKMEFCDDLLVEILSKLPFKSLARFKCVSRSWRALISGASLRARLPLLAAGLFVHAPRDGEPRYTTACSAGNGLEFCDMSFFPMASTARVVDARDGLLLYRSSAVARLYVAWPATRRWAALPVSRRQAQLPVLAFYAAASSPHFHVVCFLACRERGAAVDVYSSETGAWRERDAAFGGGGGEASSLSPATHCRGAVLHVLAYPDRVVLMDLAAASSAATATTPWCRLAPGRLPDEVDAGACLGHSGDGRLLYAKCDGEGIRVWAFDHEWKWNLTHTVRFDEMRTNGEIRLLAFHPDIADVVYLSAAAAEGEMVVRCDMRKEMVRSWKVGDGHHVVRFWLLGFSSGLLS
uniref:F-box domain-containing protein n=1 Tax=Leersia perrieri TaxID=77586 RepID=A0A0D9XA31_9ORYZ